jgi:hypothetical protein
MAKIFINSFTCPHCDTKCSFFGQGRGDSVVLWCNGCGKGVYFLLKDYNIPETYDSTIVLPTDRIVDYYPRKVVTVDPSIPKEIGDDFSEAIDRSSPREEALEIAYQTRKNILAGSGDAVSVLRACLVVANDLKKDDDAKWICEELSGYGLDASASIPDYRIVSCRYFWKGTIQNDFYELRVYQAAHILVQHVKRNEEIVVVGEDDRNIHLNVERTENLLARMVDRCLFFLNAVIAELQYGGVVEYLMEEIRRKTDERLATLDSKIADETHSLFLNLTSTNPADWTKVGHSCRKILKLLADKVFPPSDEKYTAKDGRVLEVCDPNFINRLCAFLDRKSNGEERKFLMAEAEYFESYLRQAVTYAQMVEHNPSVEKFHANMLAIHTYLIASEILRHV